MPSYVCFFFICQAVSIGELVTGEIRLCHRCPIHIVLIVLIILSPVHIALEVIKQMFEHDKPLVQIPAVIPLVTSTIPSISLT